MIVCKDRDRWYRILKQAGQPALSSNGVGLRSAMQIEGQVAQQALKGSNVCNTVHWCAHLLEPFLCCCYCFCCCYCCCFPAFRPLPGRDSCCRGLATTRATGQETQRFRELLQNTQMCEQCTQHGSPCAQCAQALKG